MQFAQFVKILQINEMGFSNLKQFVLFELVKKEGQRTLSFLTI